jgi:hypothetical protein
MPLSQPRAATFSTIWSRKYDRDPVVGGYGQDPEASDSVPLAPGAGAYSRLSSIASATLWLTHRVGRMIATTWPTTRFAHASNALDPTLVKRVGKPTSVGTKPKLNSFYMNAREVFRA